MNHRKPDDLKPVFPHNIARSNAVVDILMERQYQDDKYGGSPNDTKNTDDEWVQFINEYANKQGRAAYYDFRKRMVKVAALAMAAIEAYDIKEDDYKSNS